MTTAELRGLRIRLMAAIHHHDRSAIAKLDSTYDLDRVTRAVLTPCERKRALALRPNVNNKSCRPRRRPSLI